MRDLFNEVYESIRRNKLRTALTGFAVAWGIFMLIVLLGAGNGVINTFDRGSSVIDMNTMQVSGGVTSKPYAGYESGRSITLDNQDVDMTGSKRFEDVIDGVTANMNVSATLNYGKRYISGNIEGIYPTTKDVSKIKILYGRFINDKDIEDMTKVLVISDRNARNLLEGTGEEVADLIGKKVKAGELLYTIVGISEHNDMTNSSSFYAPFSTVKLAYNKGDDVASIIFSFHGLETIEENEQFEDRYKAVIGGLHSAAPDDESAISIFNRFTMNLQMSKAGDLLQIALWVIGLFTLLSGIVGVSNIMLITVKERTHEFGIRKAIGANPWQITKLIISESITITAIFGYIGMVLGMFTCEILDLVMSSPNAGTMVMGQSVNFLSGIGVGLDTALQATFVLIVAGTIAGLIPALKAAKVRPIEALRHGQ